MLGRSENMIHQFSSVGCSVTVFQELAAVRWQMMGDHMASSSHEPWSVVGFPT